MTIALFDTGAGFLQWVGQATDHVSAIRAHLTDAGFNSDVEYGFVALDVTPEQAAALQAWSEHGSKSPDYEILEGLPDGVTYGAAEVASIMQVSTG